jgi:Tfp pilus assembly protein PilF
MGLALVGVVAFWKGYPIVKKSRAEKFATQAEAFLEKKDFQSAGRNLQLALQISPNDPRFLRLGARFYAEQRSANAFTYYSALLRSPEATDDDRYKFLELCLILGRGDLADPVLRRLLAKEPVPARVYFFASLLTESRRDLPRAILFARSAVEKEPNERDYKYLLARMLLESTSTDDVAEGKKLLMAMAAKGDDSRAQAVRLLSGTALTAQESEQVLKWLGENKTPTVQEYFIATELLYKQNTNNLKELASKAIGKFKAGKPDEQLLLGAWLNRHKLYDQTALAVSPDKDLNNQALTMVYLDGLVGAEKWQEAYTFLNRELSIEPVMLESLRASAAIKEKKDDLAKLHWKKALTAAADKPDKIRLVAEMAERTEAYEDSMVAYRRLMANPPTANAAQTAILRIKSRTGDTKGLREFVKELLAKNKYDTSLQNFYSYLNLLLNEDVANSRGVVEKLYMQKPDDLGFRTSLALGYLREGKPEAAYGLYGATNYNLGQFPPGAKAVYVASLVAGRKTAEAETAAKTINPKELKPEEKELVKKFVK